MLTELSKSYLSSVVGGSGGMVVYTASDGDDTYDFHKHGYISSSDNAYDVKWTGPWNGDPTDPNNYTLVDPCDSGGNDFYEVQADWKIDTETLELRFTWMRNGYDYPESCSP